MPVELNATLTARSDLHHGLLIIRVQPDFELAPFKPGQYTVLGLPSSAPRSALADPPAPIAEAGNGAGDDKLIKRAYSIASSSRQGEYLEFFVALVRSGELTPRLFALNPGDRLHLGAKIVGMFTLEDVPLGHDILMVATGTGLAPYISMLRSSYDFDAGHRTIVIHAARNSWDLGYRNELEALASRWPNFHYLPVISDPEREPTWRGRTGLVYEFFDDDTVERLLGRPIAPGRLGCFLCGNPRMVEGMLARLGDLGFRKHSRREPGDVFVEEFWK
jgi:ferredoxin--NADP+ reductase